MLRHARATLNLEARKAADAGLTIAIENHQDLGSEELLAFAEEAGENVGIAFDTGNAFAVGRGSGGVCPARRRPHSTRASQGLRLPVHA